MSRSVIPDLPTAVSLRGLRPADFDLVHELLSDWNVVRYMSLPHSKTKEDSRKCLDDLMTERLDSAWLSVVHAIQSVETGDLLGLCGIAVLHESEQGEIWYLVRPDHWGRGIAQKAARELLRVGFLEMNLHRMFATCLPENPASARVLDKIGMRKECHQLKTLKIHGVWQDCFLYAILRDEWEAGIQQR